MVSHIVRAHGGAVELESEEGAGQHVSRSCCRPPADHGAHSHRGRRAGHRACASKRTFAARATRPPVATDGARGLGARSRAAAGISILLDVMLPKMDGFDVCSELRKAGVLDADHPADGARTGSRKGTRTRCRRRRLRDQAVQSARAASADPRATAAPARGTKSASAGSATAKWISIARELRRAGEPWRSRLRSFACSACSSAIAAGS